MKQLISATLFNAALDAEFSRLGIRASTLVVAAIKAACKTAGVKTSDVSREEMRAHAETAVEYLTVKGCPPCDKDGKAYAARGVTQFVTDCVRTAYGQKKAPTGPKLPVAPIDPANPDGEQDEFPNVPQAPKPMVNAQPSELALMQDVAKRIRAAKTVSRSDALALADWVMSLS